MSQYKIVFFSQSKYLLTGCSPEKTLEELEKAINEYARQGWKLFDFYERHGGSVAIFEK